MNKVVIIAIAVLLVLVGTIYWAVSAGSRPDKLDQFAQCLKDRGAVFYGAFWCVHCQNQKAMFGRSVRFLPYVECSMPDGQTQTSVCTAKGIKGYPTWEFSDGTRETGEVPLAVLAEKTKCELPQN